MTVIIGDIKTAALAADMQSAPSRKPRFAVFQFTSFDSNLTFGTAGMCI